MPFVLCCVAKEGKSALLKDWFGFSVSNDGISLKDLFDEFSTGKFDNEALPNDECRMFTIVLVGSGKRDLFTQVSPTTTITEVSNVLGSFFKFVLSAESTEQPQTKLNNAFVRIEKAKCQSTARVVFYCLISL